MEWVHLLGDGRAEKEREGVTSYMLFPSPGIYFSTEYMGRVAERMVPKTRRAKGVHVQCLSVRPLAGRDARHWAALPWEPRLQEQLWGPGQLGFPAGPPAWTLLSQSILHMV